MVVEISNFLHETLKYLILPNGQTLRIEFRVLYIVLFAICPTDCIWSPLNFAQILEHNSHNVEPEDPECDLASLVYVFF